MSWVNRMNNWVERNKTKKLLTEEYPDEQSYKCGRCDHQTHGDNASEMMHLHIRSHEYEDRSQR